jgi:hypothetical protein
MKVRFNPNIIVNWECNQIKFGAIVQVPGTPERHIVCQVRSSTDDTRAPTASTSALLRQFVDRQNEIEGLVCMEVMKGNLRPVIDLPA